LVDDVLGHQHALRAAEAAEGGAGDGVGFAAQAVDARGRQMVGVVAVEHRAVDHGVG